MEDGVRPKEWVIATLHTELKNVEELLGTYGSRLDETEKKYFAKYRDELNSRILELIVLDGDD